MNKTTVNKLKKEHILYPISALLLLLSCFFMYDFYKCLSGFIANGFRYPFMMLPIILTYLIGPVCFLFFFWDTYVRRLSKTVEIIYACFVVGLSVFCFVGIILNFSVYYSNNQLGVYDALPGLIIKFPFDGIVICTVAIISQVVRLISRFAPSLAISEKKEWATDRGRFSLSVVEYVIISVFSVVAFVFVGSSLYAFSAIANAAWDPKFIFLQLWLLVPLFDIALLVIKPEKRGISARSKIVTLSVAIAVNLIFGILFGVFEAVYPDFIIHVGKPMFLIAFSVSMPIEMIGVLGIMALSTVVLAVRLALCILKSREKSAE